MIVTYVTLEWADGQVTKHVTDGRSFEDITEWWNAVLADDDRVKSFEIRTPTDEEARCN